MLGCPSSRRKRHKNTGSQWLSAIRCFYAYLRTGRFKVLVAAATAGTAVNLVVVNRNVEIVNAHRGGALDAWIHPGRGYVANRHNYRLAGANLEVNAVSLPCLGYGCFQPLEEVQ